MRRLLLVAVVVLLAGCAAPHAGGDDLEGTIGEVDGVTADESLSITPADGFNGTELDRLVRRSMARIEVIRGQEFRRMVDVEIISRAAYRQQRANRTTGETRRAWQNQVWEGLFIVGEDRDVTAVTDETFGESVQGYYLPGQDRIVIVSDSETPTISKRTLVHELVHALQDQQFGLDNRPETQDGRMARNGVVEGEASLVPRLYLDRCDGEWSCVRPPTGSSDGGSVDPGLFQVVIYPYEQGPSFVDRFRQQGGWDAVDGLHLRLPSTTEQLLHPEKYPEEGAVDVRVPDRSSEEWSRLDHDPVGERLGEAALFSMLVTNDVIDVDDRRSYRHPVSAGWGGDRLVPYRSDDGASGYVWELAWDSTADAQAFHETYLELLAEHGAVEQGRNRYVIRDGPFADAFRVVRDGKRVRIVNAPTVEQLPAVHAP